MAEKRKQNNGKTSAGFVTARVNKGGGPRGNYKLNTRGGSGIDPHPASWTDGSAVGNYKWDGHKDRQDIADLFSESLQYWGRKPPTTLGELVATINDYLQGCEKKQQIPTYEDLALACGTTVSEYGNWISGRKGKEWSEVCTMGKAMIQAAEAKLAAAGKIPQSVYVFRAKNFYGMRDQVDYTIKPVPIADTYDIDDIKSRYLAEMPVEGEFTEIPEKAPESQNSENSEN